MPVPITPYRHRAARRSTCPQPIMSRPPAHSQRRPLRGHRRATPTSTHCSCLSFSILTAAGRSHVAEQRHEHQQLSNQGLALTCTARHRILSVQRRQRQLTRTSRSAARYFSMHPAALPALYVRAAWANLSARSTRNNRTSRSDGSVQTPRAHRVPSTLQAVRPWTVIAIVSGATCCGFVSLKCSVMPLYQSERKV
jgi:hypothetical protein